MIIFEYFIDNSRASISHQRSRIFSFIRIFLNLIFGDLLSDAHIQAVKKVSQYLFIIVCISQFAQL